MNTIILNVQDLTKTYLVNDSPLTVLDHVSFTVETGSVQAIVGPSGSGKSTLLGLCAGLDAATSGTVILNGVAIHELNEDQRAVFRNRNLGFVFQSFQLLPSLTALENVMVPLELAGKNHKTRTHAGELLAQVGLADRRNHYPAQLSGGEQQRVALARAFITQPKILFADEPTGNLDSQTGDMIITQLFALQRDFGSTLIIVTHNMELAQRAHRIIHMHGGKLES